MIFMLPALVILLVDNCVTHFYVPFATQQLRPLRREDMKNYKLLALVSVFAPSWLKQIKGQQITK